MTKSDLGDGRLSFVWFTPGPHVRTRRARLNERCRSEKRDLEQVYGYLMTELPAIFGKVFYVINNLFYS